MSLGPVRLHTTNLISGLMFVLIGVLFIAYEGTSALEGFYVANGATDLAFSAQQWANGLALNIPTMTVLAVLGVGLALFLYLRLRKYRRKKLAKW